ncbi:hypothetical protein U6G28_10170 [Actinomycetaceae bacterium MB13-C1-2]|nr:hypothetical protein U6G28_10170 [Actinomycetaceae bacterium MB13-C1-2]
MRASAIQQATLLELQQLDLKTARLSHQMAIHPTREKLAELRGRAEDLERFTIGLGAQIEDQQRELSKLEGEIEKVKTRGAVQQERLDSGKVGIRDMGAVEHEIGRIRDRQNELEGILLEQMEKVEEAENKLSDAKAQIEVLVQDEQRTRNQLEDELLAPKSELTGLVSKREQLIAELPDQVVEEYERLRERLGPVVVLRLEEGMLINSPVSVSQEELDSASVAPADELWFSEETGYLIARPA